MSSPTILSSPSYPSSPFQASALSSLSKRPSPRWPWLPASRCCQQQLAGSQRTSRSWKGWTCPSSGRHPAASVAPRSRACSHRGLQWVCVIRMGYESKLREMSHYWAEIYGELSTQPSRTWACCPIWKRWGMNMGRPARLQRRLGESPEKQDAEGLAQLVDERSWCGSYLRKVGSWSKLLCVPLAWQISHEVWHYLRPFFPKLPRNRTPAWLTQLHAGLPLHGMALG